MVLVKLLKFNSKPCEHVCVTRVSLDLLPCCLDGVGLGQVRFTGVVY